MISNFNEKDNSGIQEYIAIFKRYKIYIIIITAIVAILSAIFSFIEDPQYVAKTVVMIERNPQGTTFFPVADPIGILALMNNQKEIIKSKTLRRRVNTALKSDTVLLKKGYKDVYIRGRSLNVQPLQDTYIIEIYYKDKDPYLAAYIPNKIAYEYYKSNLEQTKHKASQMKEFLKDQLTKIERELNNAEAQLRDYKKQAKISTLKDETRILVEQATKFQTLYNETVLNLETEKKKKEYLLSQLDETQKQIANNININNEVLQEIIADITSLEVVKLNYIADGYNEKHPKIVELNEKIDNLKKKLILESKNLYSEKIVSVNPILYSSNIMNELVEAKTQIAFLEAQKNEIEKIVNKYNYRLSQLPDKTIKLAQLERNASVSEEIYLMLKRKYEEAKLQEVAEVGNVRIIDEATQPVKPVSPKKARNIILGIMGGFLLGITIAFLLNFIDESVKTNEEIEMYTGENIIGIIPYITNGKNKNKKQMSEEELIAKIKKRLITNMDAHNPVAEAYRSIRTQLKYKSLKHNKTTFVVTSAMPGEGKSTTISNLAITIANLEKKVLIIDGDLRKPFLHKIFGVENTKGLAQWITGDANINEIIHKTKIDYLDIITYGKKPVNPAELLEREEPILELISIIKKHYDYILIDAPPVNLVADPIILAGYADRILWVVFPGKSTRRELRHAKKMLIPVKDKIEGVVVNNAKKEIVGSYYSEYYRKNYEKI